MKKSFYFIVSLISIYIILISLIDILYRCNIHNSQVIIGTIWNSKVTTLLPDILLLICGSYSLAKSWSENYIL